MQSFYDSMTSRALFLSASPPTLVSFTSLPVVGEDFSIQCQVIAIADEVIW